MEEILKACEGKLGQYYKLALRTKLEKDEINNKNILNIRVRMIQETNTEPTLVCKNKAIIKLYINDEFVDKSFVDINFTNKNNLLLYTYKKDMYNKETVISNIKIILEVSEESNYLETSEIKQNFIIPPVKEDKLFIDLVHTIRNNTVYCLANFNINPDLLEYKVNQNDWIKLDIENPNFSFEKDGTNQYAQVRGKLNNYYSYSNTVKIYKE